VDANAIVDRMRAFFEGKQPPEVLAGFSELTPRALLKESLDVVDFVVYLEEELERDIDLSRLGEAIVSKTFGELAGMLAEEG